MINGNAKQYLDLICDELNVLNIKLIKKYRGKKYRVNYNRKKREFNLV